MVVGVVAALEEAEECLPFGGHLYSGNLLKKIRRKAKAFGFL